MALHGYGLLIGRITGFRPPQGQMPHWLWMVQPANPRHPPYRVAVNVPAVQPRDNSEIEFQVLDLTNHPLVRKLRKFKIGTPSFLIAGEVLDLPRLDFGRGDVVDPKKFPAEHREDAKVGSRGGPQALGPLHRVLEHAAKGAETVAVFGTGSPMDHRTGSSPATGFTGIDNVHMNQGAFNRTNGTLHYLENGRDQDGGLIILGATAATGIFIKFRSQTIHTDHRGHPRITGISSIDEVPDRIRKHFLPPIPRSLREIPRPRSVSAAAVSHHTSPAPGVPNDQGFVFADFNPEDASGEYIPDNDADTYQTPIVQSQSKGHTRGPVPIPREDPLMELASVIGTNPPGYLDSNGTETLAFDIIGDSGAPSQSKLAGYESKVADLLTRDAALSPPAFMYHVGDVVYFYGERAYYYSQFYDPFRSYPAPIFAIPGNHDGVIYESTQVSLADFQSAFCAQTPGRWPGSAGILRSTMTQPGVYFTLNHPLLSIIGLYSNCGESMGWLDEPQLTFLYKELMRLKALRRNGLPAVIMAIHHFPRWFPDQSKPDPNSKALDAVYAKAGFWPDAVICGHAHLYQRVVRQGAGPNGKQDIPYVMSGAGGYGITPAEEVGKSYMQKIGAQGEGSPLGAVVNESGYVRANVTKPRTGHPTLRFDYRSVKPKSSQPDDTCLLNLSSGRIIG
ncbi:MAG TPA: DUF2278 family protein [Steroidobacteraceae bacterium]|jgi:uncharacterized protein YukJ